MKTAIGVLILVGVVGIHAVEAQTASPGLQRNQVPVTPPAPPQPSSPPKPSVQAPAPGSSPTLQEDVGTPPQLVNIRVELMVIEEGGGEPVKRKDVSVTVADRRSGSVRSGGWVSQEKPFIQNRLRADVRPFIEKDGRIRTLVTMQYLSEPYFQGEGEQKFEPLLESGKPLVVSQLSSATSERRMRVQLTATILK